MSAAEVGASFLGGPAPWRRLPDSLDDVLQAMASSLRERGIAVVAAGAYGRRELARHDAIDVLLVGSAAPAEARAEIEERLKDIAGQPRLHVLATEDIVRRGRRDLELFATMLDSRLVCGDEVTYGRFQAALRKLARRARRPLRAELARRRRALVSAEPWQSQHPDITRNRGGLATAQTVRLIELAEAEAAGHRLVSPKDDGLASLAAERKLLLGTRAVLDRVPDPAVDEGGAGRPDSQTRRREVLLAMRAVDAAASRVFGREPRWQRVARAVLNWQPFGTPPPTDASQATDVQLLLATLNEDTPEALDPLPTTPWLERLLPEWEDIRGLPRDDVLHQHPVDTHLVRTVAEARLGALDEADAMGTALITEELRNRDELLLAALLHGIGMGHGDNHDLAGAVIAERFASRARLDDEAARRLVTVVEQHRLLVTAARRDIGDAAVIEEIAGIVGDAQTLHLLYLVSIADARATGPEAWSAWRGALIRTLYARVLEHLEATEQPGKSVLALRREAALAALHDQFTDEVVSQHLSLLPPRYLLVSSPQAIAQHLALIAQADGETALRHDPLGDFERLTVVTPDHPGILAAVSGTLAVHDVSVLGGNAYTRDDGVVIDVLHVVDAGGDEIGAARWASISEALPRAIAGEFPIAQRLREARRSRPYEQRATAPTSVHVDNSASAEYSIIEVSAGDRPGLLYAISDALHGLALDIHLAKIDTLGDEVADAFYVLRRNGRRVEAPDEIQRVCERVAEAISWLDAPASSPEG